MGNGNLDGERIELEVFDDDIEEATKPIEKEETAETETVEEIKEETPVRVDAAGNLVSTIPKAAEEQAYEEAPEITEPEEVVIEETIPEVSEDETSAELPEEAPDVIPEEVPSMEEVKPEEEPAGKEPQEIKDVRSEPVSPGPAPGAFSQEPKKKKGLPKFWPIFVIIPVILIIGGIIGFNIYKKWATDVLVTDPATSMNIYVGEKKKIEVGSQKRRVYDYKFTAESTASINVSSTGEVTATKPGNTTITIDVGRKYVEPVTVKVYAEYKPVKVKNGQMIKKAKGNKIARVELTNSTDRNCYFYFKNTKTKKNDFAIYLTKKQKKTIKAPLGTYEIYYATGNTWYGTKYLFGNSTASYKNRQKAKLYKTSRAIYGIRFRVFNMKAGGSSSSDSIPQGSFPQ